MRRLLPLLLWGLLATPAAADSGMLMSGVANRQMPLDRIGATPTGAYSLRRLLTSYATNKAINIVRASDSTATDIGFLASGSPDIASATTFCNATTCKVVTIYDQGGGGRDLTQGTDANRPSLTFSCLGSFPCMQFTSGSIQLVAAANVTPATGLVSFSVVGNRASGTNNCVWMEENGLLNRISGRNAAANAWLLTAGGANTIIPAASDAAWHTGQGVINGASSVANINGTETTGTVDANTTAGKPTIAGATSTTCNQPEAAFWDNYALTAGERTFLTNGQRAVWGF